MCRNYRRINGAKQPCAGEGVYQFVTLICETCCAKADSQRVVFKICAAKKYK
jgi:hypothetical protein